MALASLLSWLECCMYTNRLRDRYPVRACTGNNQSMFRFSLFLSLPLFLKSISKSLDENFKMYNMPNIVCSRKANGYIF